MQICTTIEELRTIRWYNLNQSWGLVPTMGYLHAGHLALVKRARAENDRVAVSIYVNPTQFAPNEDLSSYPRDLDKDLALLRAEGIDLVFTPDDPVMYPAGFQTYVAVENVTKLLEGASRPTHFQGVTTVDAKLFNIIQPIRAYFGQKDAQQTVVIKQMVGDLNFNVEVIVCPIVREADGLAMSSRNKYLNPAERHAALVLRSALGEGYYHYTKGERDANKLRQLMRSIIEAEPLARLDYVSVADAGTLQELNIIEDGNVLLPTILLSTAVYIGKTRLIDNILIE